MTRKEIAKNKQKLLEWHFSRYYQMWKDEFQDDRALIGGMYEQMMEALKDMEEVSNNYVWVAFNRAFHEDEKTMCEIIKKFTGRYPVYGDNREYYPAEF